MATKKRLIDANALLVTLSKKALEPRYQHNGENYFVGIADACGMVIETSTVDAVEVVRCKDCVYCSTKRASRYNQLLRFCEWGDGHERVQSDGKFFCAHGKRSKYETD